MGGRKESGGEQMIAGQDTDSGAEKETERTVERNKIEEKSGSVIKVGTKLKEKISSYGNVKMLKQKKDEKGRKEEREWEKTFGRSKKTPKSSIRREEGKTMGKEETRDLR